MTGNTGCPLCDEKRDIDNATCPCGNGYMNDEGSFIPGSMVTSGKALSWEAYKRHSPCATCEKDPFKCERRQKLLSSPRPRKLEGDEHEGYVEFWIPGEGISRGTLERYLEVNGGKYAFCKDGKRFKRVDGYTVRSRIRFNTGIVRELQKLTEFERSEGRLSTADLKRRAELTDKPFTEFTRYLDRSSVSSGKALSRATTRDSDRSESVPGSPPPPYTRYDTLDRNSRRPIAENESKSRHDVHKTESDDDVPELTTTTKRLELSSRSRHESSPGGTAQPRGSREDISVANGRKGSRHSQEDMLIEERTHESGSQYDQYERKPDRDLHRELDARREREPQRVLTAKGSAEHARQPRHETNSRNYSVQPGRPVSDPNQRAPAQRSRHSASVEEPTKSTASRGTTSSTYSSRRSRQESPHQDSGEDSSASSPERNVKFFVPAEGIDLVVLAFFLKTIVDTNAQIERSILKGKKGYIINAKRTLTRDELVEVMSDTEDWQTEERRLPDNARYVDSNTAKRRARRSSRPR